MKNKKWISLTDSSGSGGDSTADDWECLQQKKMRQKRSLRRLL